MLTPVLVTLTFVRAARELLLPLTAASVGLGASYHVVAEGSAQYEIRATTCVQDLSATPRL